MTDPVACAACSGSFGGFWRLPCWSRSWSPDAARSNPAWWWRRWGRRRRAGPLVIRGAQTPIRHIVFIVKENRSYDNLFGRFPGGDGTSTGRTADGSVVKLRPLEDVQDDLQHNHQAAVTDINGGAMDGFSKLPDKDGQPTMLAYTTAYPGQLPAYWGWAKRYELLDHTFSSGDTSSFPNHLYTVAAQAAGAVDGPNFGVENWGCDGPANLTVPGHPPLPAREGAAVLPDRLDRRTARPAAASRGASTGRPRTATATDGWRMTR